MRVVSVEFAFLFATEHLFVGLSMLNLRSCSVDGFVVSLTMNMLLLWNAREIEAFLEYVEAFSIV